MNMNMNKQPPSKLTTVREDGTNANAIFPASMSSTKASPRTPIITLLLQAKMKCVGP